MLTKQIIEQVLKILDGYSGPELLVQQALDEIKQEILNKFKDYV